MDSKAIGLGISRRVMLKYYGKYAYAYSGNGKGNGTLVNEKVRAFRRIALLFALFNVAASVVAIAIALVMFA